MLDDALASTRRLTVRPVSFESSAPSANSRGAATTRMRWPNPSSAASALRRAATSINAPRPMISTPKHRDSFFSVGPRRLHTVCQSSRRWLRQSANTFLYRSSRLPLAPDWQRTICFHMRLAARAPRGVSPTPWPLAAYRPAKSPRPGPWRRDGEDDVSLPRPISSEGDIMTLTVRRSLPKPLNGRLILLGRARGRVISPMETWRIKPGIAAAGTLLLAAARMN